MLKLVSKEQVIKLIKDRHPQWNDESIADDAEVIVNNLDEVFDSLLKRYIETGEKENYKYDKFSILLISSLWPGNSYLESVCMLDAYMKNPEVGRARIMRH